MKPIYKIVVILVVGLGLRLLFFGWTFYSSPNFISTLLSYPDSGGYWVIAHNFLKEGVFALHPFRTPAYPLFLAFFIKYFTNPEIYIIVFQIVVNVVTSFLVWEISSKFLKINSSIPLCLMVLDPFQIYYCSTILTETIFVFFIVAGVYFLIKSYQNSSIINCVFAGIFFGLSALTRPNAFYIVIGLILALVVYSLLIKKQETIKILVIVMMMFFLTISPWLYKNKSDYGYLEMSSITGFNLYFHNVLNTQKDMGFTEQQSRAKLENMVISLKLDTITSAFVYSHELQKLTFEFIKEYPVQFIYSHTKGVVEIMVSPNPIKNFILDLLSIKLNKIGEKSFSEIMITTFIVLFLVLIYVFALVGMLEMYKTNQLIFVLLFGIIFLFLITTGALEGATRYRMPAMPFIYVFATVGILKIKTIFVKY